MNYPRNPQSASVNERMRFTHNDFPEDPDDRVKNLK